MVEVTEADKKLLQDLAINLGNGGSRHNREQLVATHRIEAAKAERDRCEKVARDYAAKARSRGWPASTESAARAAEHIATAIKESQL